MIEQITSTEKTQHNSGSWWCGRYAMHRWKMPINEVKTNFNDVKKVIIVTPIWVFTMCAPIRCFLNKHSEILKEKDITIVFNHFNSWLPKTAVKEVKTYFNKVNIISYTTHYGVSHLNK